MAFGTREHPFRRSGTVLACLLLWTVCFGGAERPKVLLRIYTQTEDQGGSNRTLPVQLTNPDQQIFVSAIPEATEKDLMGIESAAGEGNTVGAILHFTPHAAMNLDAATSQGEGKIMVVVLDGRIIYSPVIDMTLSKSDLLIPRGITPQEFSLLKATAAQNVKDQKL